MVVISARSLHWSLIPIYAYLLTSVLQSMPQTRHYYEHILANVDPNPAVEWQDVCEPSAEDRERLKVRSSSRSSSSKRPSNPVSRSPAGEAVPGASNSGSSPGNSKKRKSAWSDPARKSGTGGS